MTGVILLDQDNKYVYSDGSLPKRPEWDKQFLTDLIRGALVLCSENTFKTIPKSMLKVATFTTNIFADVDINFGIKTFGQMPPDLMIVVRGPEKSNKEGKTFRMNNYNKIFEDEKGLELWVIS